MDLSCNNLMRILLKSLLDKYVTDVRGSVAVIFSFAAVALFGVLGLTVDYALWTGQRAKLQSAADAAALASATEGPIHSWNSEKLTAIATEFAKNNLATAGKSGPISRLEVTVAGNAKSVTVRLQQTGQSYFTQAFLSKKTQIEVSARATLHGEASICVLALDPAVSRALSLDGVSAIQGDNCAVLSNSNSSSGLSADLAARLKSGMTCTSGGYRGLPVAFNPTPLADCPVTPDPLMQRAMMDTGVCLKTDFVIDGGYQRLIPGTYCGTTRAINGASLQLSSGIYTFTDGHLEIAAGAELVGNNVSLQFKGPNAGFKFDQDTKISLTAPSDGASAGILLHADKQPSDSRPFHIMSADAELLIGVIYLPTGQIVIGGDINLDGVCDLLNGIIPSSCKTNVGQKSHWTAIIANIVTTTTGANVILNTDFATSDIPAPEGIGGKVVLEY